MTRNFGKFCKHMDDGCWCIFDANVFAGIKEYFNWTWYTGIGVSEKRIIEPS